MSCRLKLLVATSCAAAMLLGTTAAFAEPLSEKQWRKQANVFCKQSNKKFDSIYGEALGGLGENEQPSAEQLVVLAQQVGPSIEQTIASIDALAEPKALRKDVKKWLVLGNDVVSTLEADPSSVIDDKLFVKVNKVGKRLRLACGN